MLFAWVCVAIFLQGWMNEIQNYNPETYHATLTHSVFVRLEGSTLRISKPNKNITRRASYNEPKPDVIYISQKIYDLTGSKVCICVEWSFKFLIAAKYCLASPVGWDIKNIPCLMNYVHTTGAHESWFASIVRLWTRKRTWQEFLQEEIARGSFTVLKCRDCLGCFFLP